MATLRDVEWHPMKDESPNDSDGGLWAFGLLL